MTPKDFFALVARMRKLQKIKARQFVEDPITNKDLKQAEDAVDAEIKRVESVLKEKMQPRFFEL